MTHVEQRFHGKYRTIFCNKSIQQLYRGTIMEYVVWLDNNDMECNLPEKKTGQWRQRNDAIRI